MTAVDCGLDFPYEYLSLVADSSSIPKM